jgi:5-oxoprolinase (ATP-hydrolysing)
MGRSQTRWRVGFDIGGTFTDFVLFDGQSGTVFLHKRLTTPHDPSDAAIKGLEEIVAKVGISLADIDEIVHGTTLVTNAIIEQKGAKLGLITTNGFRDVLEIGREQRYDIYDLFLKFPEPLVSRDLRLTVGERMDRDGRVIEPLDVAAVRACLGQFAHAGVDAVAVCFLNSYANPKHERAVGKIAREEFPSLAVSLSSDVVSEISEYERFVTTCANAYVQPVMHRYLRKLEERMSNLGFRGGFYLMHSAGGLVSLETAGRYPIRLLESGPAGGALATALFGELAGKKDVLSFDMGGTTAKACIIEDGRAEIAPSLEAGRVHRFAKGSGLPIRTPTIDLIEIGAGGGSIASIDDVGLLKVGPHSAGSDPGPACYSIGGTKPTVTDANLILGYYDPGFFLGGRMALSKAAATTAVNTIAKPLNLSVEQAAWGIHKVVVEGMAAAARVHLVEKGKDPRQYAMIGFGGAGPAHACDVARVLGIKEVIIPPASGAASALGFLSAPLSFELVRSRPVELSPGFDASGINALLNDLEKEGRTQLRDAGVADADIVVERSADMRLVGQIHDLIVALPPVELCTDNLPEIRAAFTKTYSSRYTTVFEEAKLEALNFRVRCSGPVPQLTLRGAVGGGKATSKLKGSRRAWFDGAYVNAKVYDRYALEAGDQIQGPAIIEEHEATTVIAPEDKLEVDKSLNLRIAVRAVSEAEVVITDSTPLDEAISKIEADPISLEIMWSRLVTVVEEMWTTVCRTAFSLVISDSQDFACELLDPNGDPVVHSPRAMPAFNFAVPLAVKALLKAYPAGTLVPGDVLITNDPWVCAGHLYDLAIVTPVFRHGRMVGLVATVAHVADIGGTKNPVVAREIFDEGFQIPSMKLFDGGKPNETLFRLLAQNVRDSDQVIGDVHAIVAANAIGAERLQSFMADYGMADIRALTAVVQGKSEKAMRTAISAIPDGVYTAETWFQPMDKQLRLPLKLTVAGDEIELNFEGAPPQLSPGAFNSTLSYSSAAASYPLKCILTPEVRGNAGCYRPFKVAAPEGSILNCKYPASVSQRTKSGWYIAPTVFRALADAVPHKVQAFTGIPVNPRIYGLNRNGRAYSDMFFSGGGQGASARGDGKSSLLFPTSAGNTSIELFESRVPVVVVQKSYIADSGGAGQYRGGLGQIVQLRKLYDDKLDTLITFFPDVVSHPGLRSGKAGIRGSGQLRTADGRINTDFHNGGMVRLTDSRETLEIILAGGSGYGDPLKRAREDVASDVKLGLVSETGAKSDYGYFAKPKLASLATP